MSDKAFIDTNVLVYAIGHDPFRTERAETVLASGGVISVQVLNELASVASRKLKLPWPEVGEVLAAIRAILPVAAPVTVSTHEQALKLSARYGFGLYDALIAASALEAGCRTLLTEDFQAGQLIEGQLTVVNPFAT